MTIQNAPTTFTASMTKEELENIKEMVRDLCFSSDIFRTDHSGYWAQMITHGSKLTDDPNPALGWLFWDMEEDTNDDAAIAAFKSGGELPKGYYRLGKEEAIKIIHQGIFQHGIGFVQGDADAGMVDGIIQKVLLGEIVHG